MKSLVLLCATLVATSTALTLPAAARSIRVQYGELDLSGPQGRQILLARLHRAAEDICGDVPTAMSSPLYRKAYRRCETDTVNRAISSLPQAAQTALLDKPIRSASR